MRTRSRGAFFFSLLVLATTSMPSPLSAQQRGNGDLFSLAASGQWTAIGVSIPSGVVDVEGGPDALVARTSSGTFLRYDTGTAAWKPWSVSLPAGTAEVRFLGDLVGPGTTMAARTSTQALYMLRSSAWVRMAPDFPAGTVRFGAGSGLFAVTAEGSLFGLSETTWIDLRSSPGLSAGLISFQDTIYSLQGDGSFRRFDFEAGDFVPADVVSIIGARAALIYKGRLTVWK
jgi:hypothetical protein